MRAKIGLTVTMLLIGVPARAADLSTCLLAHTSSADRTMFIKWVFSAVSSNPAVTSLSSMTLADREEISKTTGVFLQRLMTVDCRSETIAALKTQGLDAFKEAFGTFGKTAMNDLLADPNVQARFDLEKYVDASKFEELGKDAAK